jgi:GT2 family glycosyltransferase
MQTAIVILNYNGRDLLRKFLPLVIGYSPGATIVVADNASTDGSPQILRDEFPEIQLIEIEKNLGFCGGYNRALQHVIADYYVLLNSDVEVTAGWLDPLVTLLHTNPMMAAAQPKILSHRDRNMFEYAGAGGGFIDVLAYPFCRGRLFDTLEEDTGQFDDTRDVFWASGACMMVRAQAFHEAGGFDEDFFAHMEEIDLCWRFHRAGLRVGYAGNARVYHVGGGTLSKSNPRKTFLNFRNGLSLMVKHFAAGELIWKLPTRLVLDWLAAVRFLMIGSEKDYRAVALAHLHFLKGLPRDLRKRRAIHQSFTAPGRYSHSIVVDYFLRKRKYFRELKF